MWGKQKNIRWKVAIDGHGCSTPIVWDNKVFLLTAIDTGEVDPSLPKPEDQPDRVFGIKFPNTVYEFVVLCLDRDSGKEIWRRTATRRIPHEGHHPNNSFASASPTTDGERLYCWFGSAGLFCYDLDGTKVWDRDLGKVSVQASLGEGCSPVVQDGRLVIVRDHGRQSTIEVLDAKTGKTLWKKDRDEPNAWATPIILDHSGKTQIITAASNRIRSYDLNDGAIIWQCSGLTGNVIPSPVVDGDVIYCMSGYQGYALLALPLSATGDISHSDAIVWTKHRGTPYIPSPLLYDGRLYFTQSNQAILSCLDSQTGATIMDRTRLPGISAVYASLVGADGHIYITGRNGTTLVLGRSKELNLLATNKLDDPIEASPALAGDQLFLRSSQFLYCILVRRGIETTVIELADQVLPPWDPEMTTPIAKHLVFQGVRLVLNDSAAAFDVADDGLVVRLSSGETVATDFVVLSVGVRPENTLAVDAGLDVGPRGGIRVNQQMQTTDPNIYAVGDAVEVTDFVGGQPAQIPLAGPANRQGRIAADHAFGRDAAYRGTQGTAVVGVFDWTAAMTGLSEKSLRRSGQPYQKIYIHPAHHAGYYPGAERMTLKLLFHPETGRVLGAQAVGGAGVDKRIDVLLARLLPQPKGGRRKSALSAPTNRLTTNEL